MALTLIIRSAAGQYRSMEVNPGDELALNPGEVIESFEGADPDQVEVSFAGGVVSIAWPDADTVSCQFVVMNPPPSPSLMKHGIPDPNGVLSES